MEIMIITIMLMFIGSLALIMLGAEEDLNGLIIAGLISLFLTIMLALTFIFGIVTILSWLLTLFVINFLIFAVCYKVQRLVNETDPTEMIIFAAIPICNVIVTFVGIWYIMNNKYQIAQKTIDWFSSITNKIQARTKKILNGILNFIDKLPPNIHK